MSKTERAQTLHGDVEYEVAECASCGQEHRPGNMSHLYDGVIEDVTNYSSWESVRFKDNTFEPVYFCDHCYDEPIRVDVPVKITRQMLLARSIILFLMGLFAGIVLVGVL